MPDPLRVLFLCVHNSARSQMAEGLLRHFGGDRFDVHSAGAEPTAAVRPLAVKVMAQRGIDISQQRPKLQDIYVAQHWDYVITTCDESREACPIFPSAPNQIHWRFDDPSAAQGTAEEQERFFWRVSTEIERRIRLFATVAKRGDRVTHEDESPVVRQVREIVDGADAAPANRPTGTSS